MALKGIELVGLAAAVLTILAVGLKRLLRRWSVASTEDEIPVQRDYQPIEPEAESNSLLERALGLVQNLHHTWAVLMIPVAIVAGVIAVLTNPLVRAIILSTLAVMAVIVAVWAVHDRLTRQGKAPRAASGSPR